MKTLIPAIGLGLVLTSAVVLAGPFAGGHPQDRALGMLQVMADEIGLSVSQEQVINQLVDEARLASAVDRERLSQLHQQMRQLTEDVSQFDEAAVEAVADELANLVSRMAVDGAQLRWEVRQVLTEEQRQQLDSVRRHARMSHFRFTDGLPSEL